MKRPPFTELRRLNQRLISTFQFYNKANAWQEDEDFTVNKNEFLVALAVMDYVLNGSQYQLMNSIMNMVEVAEDAKHPLES